MGTWFRRKEGEERDSHRLSDDLGAYDILCDRIEWTVAGCVDYLLGVLSKGIVGDDGVGRTPLCLIAYTPSTSFCQPGDGLTCE